MWWPDSFALPRRWMGPALALALAGLTAACFQPLYGARDVTGGSRVRDGLAAIEVVQIEAPKGTSEARLAVELRNQLLFEMRGGDAGASPTHRLVVRMTTSRQAIIVDITTGRNEAVITGINATYTLTELATGKTVLSDTTFSRVSSDVPGQQQRFAQARAYRDAEDRAAKVIAELIRSRLASYLVART